MSKRTGHVANPFLKTMREQHCWSQEDVAEKIGSSAVNVSRWERGITFPTPYFRQRLCALFGKSAQELGLVVRGHPSDVLAEDGGSVGDPSHPQFSSYLWNVPYPRNPFFTGRAELLHSLYEMLNRGHAMVLAQSLAISGLGGIGKTQVALEYAYRYRQDYRYILWINASTRESLLADFLGVAELLQLPEKDERDQNRVLQAVRKWFAAHDGWLLILDNADEVAMVRDFMPLECPGHLVLTSRAQALGPLAQRLEIEEMGIVEGTLFLLRRAGLLSAGSSLEDASVELLAGAEAIVMEMAFLPLALDQAGAYIDEVGCSLAAYLELYRTRRQELLQRRGQVPTDYPASVATTWSLSFQRVEQANPAAGELLRLWAFLEPDSLPEDLFCQGSAVLGPVLRQAAKDPLVLNEAIEELRKFSLVQRHADPSLLRIHRLVQVVLRDTMRPGAQRRWAERAVRATSAVFPEKVEVLTWPLCLRYLSQAQSCTLLIQDYALVSVEAASLLYRAALYLHMHALYEQAEPLFQRTVHMREQVLGREHLDVAQSLNALANLYQAQGKFERAEPLYRQALEINEKALGLDHPDVTRPLNNLATLFTQQGKYEQAEPLYRQALQIRELALGPEHFDVAHSLLGLASLCHMQGKYEQAEPLYQRAVYIWEQMLGLDHPILGDALNNLAMLFSQQRKYEQAEGLHQKALQMRKHLLGPQHPDVAHSLHGLADLYREQGRLEEAESLYWQVLHPDTAGVLYDFAVLKRLQGQEQEAVALYRRALAIQEQVFGAESPQAIATRTAYTELLRSPGQCDGEEA